MLNTAALAENPSKHRTKIVYIPKYEPIFLFYFFTFPYIYIIFIFFYIFSVFFLSFFLISNYCFLFLFWVESIYCFIYGQCLQWRSGVEAHHFFLYASFLGCLYPQISRYFCPRDETHIFLRNFELHVFIFELIIQFIRNANYTHIDQVNR